MKVGINWLSPYTLPTVQRLLNDGVADFCEIMVDNAVHLTPEKILAVFHNVPLALHIVSSGFLTKSYSELKDIAQHLRPWIKALEPTYVSDHLPQLNYLQDFAKIRERVEIWQELLDVTLLLENNASMNVEGAGQAEFYEQLAKETGCELLFDFSNAYIAEHNGAEPFNKWQPLIKQASHFHSAGYYIDPKTNIAYDTHDAPIADEVIELMWQQMPPSSQTLVVEFDANSNYETAKEEILRIKTVMSSPDETFFVSSEERQQLSAATSRMKQKTFHPGYDFVTEWSLRGLDHIPAKGIIMRSRHTVDLAIGLWKSSEPSQPHKIVTLDISPLNLPPIDAYAVSYQSGSWDLQWIQIPSPSGRDR